MVKGTDKASSGAGAENSPERPRVARNEFGEVVPGLSSSDPDDPVGHEAAPTTDQNSETQGEAESADSADSPQTCCPNCQTVFEVAPDLLASDDTRVRCGECLIIFDALTNLRNDDFVDDDDFMVDEHGNIIDSESMLSGAESLADDVSETVGYGNASALSDARAAALAGLSSDESVLDMTYSDIDLFSEEAGLPDVVYFDRTQDANGYDFDALEVDETFNDTLFSQDLTADAIAPSASDSDIEVKLQGDDDLHKTVDFITDESPSNPIVFNYRDKDPTPVESDTDSGSPHTDDSDESKLSDVDELLDQARINNAEPVVVAPPDAPVRDKKRAFGLKSLLVIISIGLFGGLYIHREQKSLLFNPTIRPMLESVCSWLNCSLPVQQDLNAFKVLKRTVYTHPSIDDALVIDLAFINQATFAQPYPTLGIRLTDRNGALVVKNDVAPAQYLDNWQASNQLAVGQRLDLTLTVEDPGQTATSFELDFQ